ncbi:MAG: endonuclease/exonuclease/phosphatase family protein [Bacteroidales bacterium]|nr:endonuclease/exonuclease/phosphatase family protein [Bacteroidales bacterium]MBR5018835.1 endonuclease/exonuclease/phosphatase family protein [Bacteroidales bacterium]
MKHFSFLLLVLAAGLLLMGQSAEARKRPVRLMTYNVGAFGKELEDSAPMIARMIVELGAETVALNELDSCNRRHNINQVQHLADALNGLSTTGKRKGKWQGRFGRAMAYVGGAYGCGVVTKARIVDGFFIPLPISDGDEPRVCVVVETRHYVFASCHLDYKGDESRSEQARVLTEALQARYGKSRKPVFLAGDFNDEPGSAVIRQMSRDWTLLSPLEYTSSAKNPEACIDYIWVLHNGAKAAVLDSAVPTIFATGDVTLASDHLPVYVDVVF